MDGSLSHPPGSDHCEAPGEVPDIVTLSGRLDSAGHETVRVALAAALTRGGPHGPGQLVVDLGAVWFLDAGTIRLLRQARYSALGAGRQFRVTGAHGSIRRAIEASGAAFELLESSGIDGPAGALPPPRAAQRQPVPDDQSRLQARLQQRTIDAEVLATRRTLLTRLRRQLQTDPGALLNEAFLAVADTGTVLDAIIEAAIIAGAADACHLQLHDPHTATLHLIRQRGLTESFVAVFTSVHLGNTTACARAAATGEPVIVNDITRSPVVAGQPAFDVMRDAGIRAVHSYPLAHDAGNLLGVLSFHYRTKAPQHGHSELLAWCAARALARTVPQVTGDPGHLDRSGPGAAAATFAVTRTDRLASIVLSLAGSLDAASAPFCDQAVTEVLAAVTPGRTIVIDLRRLDFIAAAGVRALLRAVQAAREAGAPIEVAVVAGQQLGTILNRIDVDGRLPLVEYTDQYAALGQGS